MENSDVFGSSTAPLTWHDFLERMRHPSAADFVKAIKSFIVSFMNNAPDAERDSAAVQEFLANMEAAFRAHSLWAGSSEEELESAGEGLEKYVMTKLFTRVFASIPEDVKADEQLNEKMALIQQFIRPENLDIKPTYQNETSWLLAQKELQKINMYKAPRDKLVCILNCCKVISNLLVNASLASKEDHPGADEFLPVLIYVTIKANPPQLHSNLSYIQRFRRQTRLVAESAYFFTNMLSVESFIMSIDGKSLSMDETEFENNMESAKTLLSGLSDTSDTHSQVDQNSKQIPRPDPTKPERPLSSKGPPSHPQASVESSDTKSRSDEKYVKDTSSLNKTPSISDLENRGAGMLLKEDDANRVFRDFPFLYSQAGDLTVGDIEDLLNNYKQLVFKYVCLAKGLGVTVPSSSLSNHQGRNLEQTDEASGLEKATESHPNETESEKVMETHQNDEATGLEKVSVAHPNETESEKVMETNPKDDTRSENPGPTDDSDERPDSVLESLKSMESMVMGESAVQFKDEEASKNPQ